MKTIALASFIPEFIFALLAMLFFWMTIGHPETMTPGDVDSNNNGVKHAAGFSPDTVNQAMCLEPGKLLKQGKTAEAIEQAGQLSKSKPYDLLSNICCGNVLCQVGDKEEGFKLLKKAVALAPRSRYVRMNLAEKLAADKRYDEAINQFNLIVEGYPHWIKPHLSLSAIYWSLDEFKKAADEYKLALDSDPNNGTVRKQRALALARAGQERLGLEEYVAGEQAELNFIGTPPDIVLAIQNWGSIDRAEHEYRRELDNDSDDPLTKFRLARILIIKGQIGEAKTMLTEAAKKAPNNAEIHRNLAVVLQRLGESNIALVEFKRSINLDKQAARLKQEREREQD